ncbi:MAG: bleomycin resistance family protein [Chitinophagaceae bacterium]|nr:MAG: bleomycin resistance family protein [Chitinophagaceae bacterium]
MVFKSLHPVLWTDRFEETIEFYTVVLGFHVRERNDEWQWAMLEKDAVALMISRPNAHASFQELGFSGSFYFRTDSIDELWVSLKEKVRICYGIENFEWEMREFSIYDNNGYILQFGQETGK